MRKKIILGKRASQSVYNLIQIMTVIRPWFNTLIFYSIGRRFSEVISCLVFFYSLLFLSVDFQKNLIDFNSALSPSPQLY